MAEWKYSNAEKAAKKWFAKLELTDDQEYILMRLLKKIWYCEDGIDQEYWCDGCKDRKKRILELANRFYILNGKAEEEIKGSVGPRF